MCVNILRVVVGVFTKKRIHRLVLAGILLICGSPLKVPATTIFECFNCIPDPPGLVGANPTPDQIVAGTVIFPTTSVSGLYRSPYENADGNLSAGTAPGTYTALLGSPDSPTTQAKFAINAPGLIPAGAPTNTGALGIGLLWGSPDYYNSIQFFDSNNLQVGTTITAADLAYPHVGPIGGSDATGQDFVLIWPGAPFAYVILSTTKNAFKFTYLFGLCAPPGAACSPASHSVTATPRPMALPLFVVGFGALGLLG